MSQSLSSVKRQNVSTLEVYLTTHILAYTYTYKKISSKTSAVGQFAMQVKFYHDNKKNNVFSAAYHFFLALHRDDFQIFSIRVAVVAMVHNSIYRKLLSSG